MSQEALRDTVDAHSLFGRLVDGRLRSTTLTSVPLSPDDVPVVVLSKAEHAALREATRVDVLRAVHDALGFGEGVGLFTPTDVAEYVDEVRIVAMSEGRADGRAQEQKARRERDKQFSRATKLRKAIDRALLASGEYAIRGEAKGLLTQAQSVDSRTADTIPKPRPERAHERASPWEPTP